MNRHILFLAAFLISTMLNAQIESKYGKGAVPEVEGKVVFSKTIKPKQNTTDQQLFDVINQWAEKNYNEKPQRERQRVLLSDSDKKQVACSGDMLLVFGRKLLSFDSSPMYYQLVMSIDKGECEATIRNIRYVYNIGRDNEEDMSAEETITDKVAINKKGTKLNFFYDKFRRVTIDSIEQVFTSLEEAINGKSTITQQPVEKQIQYVYVDKATGQEVAPPTTPVATVTGEVQATATVPTPVSTPAVKTSEFKAVSIQDMPKDFIRLLEKPALIAITKNGKVAAATWAGTNDFFGKQVSMVIMNSQAAPSDIIEAGDTYTISFFTSASRDALAYSKDKGLIDAEMLKEKGLNAVEINSSSTTFGEASIIIECRKITDQTLTNASINTDEYKSDIPAEWQKSGLDKLYFNVGEILNVWVK